MNVDCCPGTLKPGFKSYSPAALRKVFYGKKVDHLLSFLPPEKDQVIMDLFRENRLRLSISGVQKKLSLTLKRNKLIVTDAHHSGLFILKPIPEDLKEAAQVPANEHVTMQIAEQVFGISTAANALIFFQDGQPAYLTRRFDRTPDGGKYAVEDFASLTQKTKYSHGEDFKYDGSYEDLFRFIKANLGAYRLESQRLFRLILFNYVFSNGDAHLKNFSFLETINGDYLLSPAYDLICTRLHVNDPDVALKDGIFADDYDTESFKANGFYAFDDFFILGIRVGLSEEIVRKEIGIFITCRNKVIELLQRSFLSLPNQRAYLALLDDKLSRLNYSFENLMDKP